jgi:phospholipase/carboxylesterase
MTAKLSGPMLPPMSGGDPKQLMVLLHGYGADGADLIGLGGEWSELWPYMLFVAPNAPEPTPFGRGRQWFPLNTDRIAGRIEGAANARPAMVGFLDDLWAQTGLTAADTVLCGFSQGAMMALHVGTSLTQRLRAIVAFSGAFVPAEGFHTGHFARPPVVLIHGEFDQVVDPNLSRQAEVDLLAAGFEARLHISPDIGHGIAADGLEFATAFMLEQMALKA